MTLIQYKGWNPTGDSLASVVAANDIIEEYEDQGYTLTLRQLYYQLVARAIIVNTQRSYKNLGTLITKARLAGMVSWEAIEDRNRKHNKPYVQDDDDYLIRQLHRYIKFDRWSEQEYYLEVWVEKEALGNVIERACDPWMVSHMACKGYMSSSETWRAGQRFRNMMAQGRQCRLIHLGDHDPSGLDMTRDNQDRLDMFTRQFRGVEVERIALNMDQIEAYSPPPNFAKESDSRSGPYVAEFGTSSWELDALEPSVMEELVVDKIKSYIDFDAWNDVGEAQRLVKDRLKLLGHNWEEVKDFLEEL